MLHLNSLTVSCAWWAGAESWGMWRSQPISTFSCAKSAGFGCRYGFVARSKLPAIMATV